jgi:plastocyanin
MMIPKNGLYLLPIAIAILAPIVAAWEQPKEYRVDPWGVPDGVGYPTLDGAKPGDIVSFYWTGSGYSANDGYNVYLYPTESCADETDKEWVGDTSGASYEIKEWDQGKSLHFACDKDDYCERGMSIVINVSAGPAPAPTGSSWGAAPTPWPTEWVAPTEPPSKSPTPWPTYAATPAPTRFPTKAPTAPPAYADTSAPTEGATEDFNEDDFVADVEPKEILIDNWDIPEDTQPFTPIEANVGDTIKWTINPGHDVWKHPSLSCDRSGSSFVGDATVGGSYTFLPEDGSVEGTEHLFACQVGSHCDLGMQLLVTVFAQPQAAEPEVPQEEESDAPQPIESDVGKNLNLEWLIPADTQPFESVDMNVGDSITFTMGPGHNVFIHPSGSCDQTDGVFVGDETVTYTFKAEDGSPDGKPMFFACDVGSHCDLGMQISVNVFSQTSASGTNSQNPPSSPSFGEADRVSGREIFIDWDIPEDNQAFDPIEAIVGDTLIFAWEGEDQNVFIHPSLTCDETLSVFVGLSNPTAYTFEPSDGSPEGKEHLFVSDVGENCELGMQLLVKVFSASDVTSDGTNSANPSTSTSPTSSAPAFTMALTLASMAGAMVATVLMF